MNRKKLWVLRYWLFALVMFGFSNNVCYAEKPEVVSGKVLEMGGKIEDSSNWMEIAKYRGYSLIMRVDPLPNCVCFDNRKDYCGCCGSNAQLVVNRWFDGLSEESILKKYAVGNTALANLGCHGELNDSRFKNVCKSKNASESMGNGISLPCDSENKYAFLLSYQEARNYVSCENNDCDLAFENYKMLKDYACKLIRGEYILDSWLRSPGMYKSTCSYIGSLFLTGSINSGPVSEYKCCVRPCLWVRTAIFSGTGISDQSLEFEDIKAEKMNRPIEVILKPLNVMIGMTKFKDVVRRIILREITAFKDGQVGLKVEKTPISMVLTGNPGTGKTTVAEKFCEILYDAGIIQKKNMIKVEKKDLVGKYVGHTEANVKAVLEKAEGGVLFIDEAYTLTSGGDRDFGQHVVDGLLTAMTENKCIIIVAGYPGPMKEFIQSNPGLKSRFRHHVHLDDYGSEELFEMFKKLCEKSGYKLEDENNIKNILLSHFEKKLRDRDFGNGRYVGNFFAAVKEERAEALAESLPGIDRTIIRTDYIVKAIKGNA